MRQYRTFTHRGTRVRILCDRYGVITSRLIELRKELDIYLLRHADFATSMTPVDAISDAPESARRMAAAAQLAGVGPMAAVAGTFAAMAGEAGLLAGAAGVVVDNGGDVFMSTPEPVLLQLDSGGAGLGSRLALRITPKWMPCAVCSSSGRMGHSTSLGKCDLATVVAADASLADAAATRAANCVEVESDIEEALACTMAIDGVAGVLLVKADRVGLAGKVPELVRAG